jgi:hypothetical protein
MTRSFLAIFLIVVGLLWAGAISWLFVALGGTGELTFAYIGKALLWYSWMFIGPLLLIAGATLSLGSYHKAGANLSLIGCVVLTIVVGYQSISMIRDLADPLIMKPPYGKWTLGVVLTLLADFAAVQFYRWK